MLLNSIRSPIQLIKGKKSCTASVRETHQKARCPYPGAQHGLCGHMTLCQVLRLHVWKQQKHICHNADDGYRYKSRSHTPGAVTDTHLSTGILHEHHIRHYSSFYLGKTQVCGGEVNHIN